MSLTKSRIVVTCAKGLSSFLSREIRSLGLEIVREAASGVTTEGTLDDTMALNLHVRTGHRVLLSLGDFVARNAQELYEEMGKISWEEHIPVGGSITVHSSIDNATIRDSRYPNLKAKDAIVDRMRRKLGSRPNSGPEREGSVIFIYWKSQNCSVYLDTSGEALSKRGYRRLPWKAPMQESLASGVIMASGWDGQLNFINPMCGSGTLAIEAALMGINSAPGLLRSNYAFRYLKGFDEASWERMREKARDVQREECPGRIIATDADPDAVAVAIKNAANAGVGQLIEFAVCDFFETDVPVGGGVVVVNPEYGERLGAEKDLPAVYRRLGDFFKQKCRGYTGCIFTGDRGLAKAVGLRSKKRTVFYNGSIECRLIQYELYEGSRKNRPREEDGKEKYE